MLPDDEELERVMENTFQEHRRRIGLPPLPSTTARIPLPRSGRSNAAGAREIDDPGGSGEGGGGGHPPTIPASDMQAELDDDEMYGEMADLMGISEEDIAMGDLPLEDVAEALSARGYDLDPGRSRAPVEGTVPPLGGPIATGVPRPTRLDPHMPIYEDEDEAEDEDLDLNMNMDMDMDLDDEVDFDDEDDFDEDDEDDDEFGTDDDASHHLASDPRSADGEFGSVPLILPRRSFKGARNAETVKDCNFLGTRADKVCSGSDDGCWFVWDKNTGRLDGVWEGDESVVNGEFDEVSSCRVGEVRHP